MLKKFNKHRAVDRHWLDIPVKYLSEVKGAKTRSKGKYKVTEEYARERYKDYTDLSSRLDLEPDSYENFKQSLKENGDGEFIPSKHDKEFCIIELSKRIATCAWRNTQTGKVGMTFRCKVESRKGGVIGIIYKDKFYPINKSSTGWVF